MERFYRRLGGYLAVFHVLRARDMHFENLIAASEFPVPVDLETLFHGDPPVAWTDDPAFDAFHSSVMQVMLLPTPVDASDTGEVVDMSAFGARSGQPFPLGGAVRWEEAGTDEMRLVRSTELPRMAARSRPCWTVRRSPPESTSAPSSPGSGGVPVDRGGPRRAAGDRRHPRSLRRRRGALRRPSHGDVRPPAQVLPSTRSSARRARTRPPLGDPLAGRCAQPHLTRLVSAEVRDLQRGDVPLFTSRADSRDLWASEGERITEVFERSAMALVREGLQPDGRRGSGATGSSSSPPSWRAATAPPPRPAASRTDGPEAIDLARAVGDMLCRDALRTMVVPAGSESRPWEPRGAHRFTLWTLTLYEGLPGCSLFLAYLGALTGDESYQRVARKAVTLLRRHLERGRAGGAPVSNWARFRAGRDRLRADAPGRPLERRVADRRGRALARDVPALIGADEALDVVGGAAGAIAALEVLNRVRPGDQLLDAALLCGERLL